MWQLRVLSWHVCISHCSEESQCLHFQNQAVNPENKNTTTLQNSTYSTVPHPKRPESSQNLVKKFRQQYLCMPMHSSRKTTNGLLGLYCIKCLIHFVKIQYGRLPLKVVGKLQFSAILIPNKSYST